MYHYLKLDLAVSKLRKLFDSSQIDIYPSALELDDDEDAIIYF